MFKKLVIILVSTYQVLSFPSLICAADEFLLLNCYGNCLYKNQECFKNTDCEADGQQFAQNMNASKVCKDNQGQTAQDCSNFFQLMNACYEDSKLQVPKSPLWNEVYGCVSNCTNPEKPQDQKNGN